MPGLCDMAGDGPVGEPGVGILNKYKHLYIKHQFGAQAGDNITHYAGDGYIVEPRMMSSK